jgi:hypothetical protein
MAGKLIAVNKINILARPSTCKVNLLFKLGSHAISKASTVFKEAKTANASVAKLAAIAVREAIVSFFTNNNTIAVKSGSSRKEINIVVAYY